MSNARLVRCRLAFVVTMQCGCHIGCNVLVLSVEILVNLIEDVLRAANCRDCPPLAFCSFVELGNWQIVALRSLTIDA